MTTTDGNGAQRHFRNLAVCALITAAILLIPTTDSAGFVTSSHDQKICLFNNPSYWCQNLTNAGSCDAVHHCIQTVWETQKYPDDTDEICTICKKMVVETRDALKTIIPLETFQEVIYRSCQLLPLKTVKTECTKLADVFIIEFLDTLVSKMNSNVVCTVSGLCNSERIDKLLLEYKQYQPNIDEKQSKDTKLAITVNNVENSILSISRDEMLRKILIATMVKNLDQWCAKFLLKWKTLCTDFIAYQLHTIVSQIPAQEMCVMMDFCEPETLTDRVGGDVETNAITPSTKDTAILRRYNMIKFSTDYDQKLEKPKLSTPLCSVCTIAMKYLHNEIKDKSNESEIQAVLKSMYSLHNVEEKKYRNFVDSNYPFILNLIKVDTDPVIACSLMRVCNENTAKVEIQSDELSKGNEYKQSIELDNSVECSICRTFVKVFEDRLNNDPVVIEKTDLIELCSEVNLLYNNRDSNRIKIQLIDLLIGCTQLQKEGPDNDFILRNIIKTTWPNCPGRCVTLPLPVHLKCTACESSIYTIKFTIKVQISAITQEIKFNLKPLCRDLVAKDTCDHFVDRITVAFMNKLFESISSEVACQNMGYCS